MTYNPNDPRFKELEPLLLIMDKAARVWRASTKSDQMKREWGGVYATAFYEALDRAVELGLTREQVMEHYNTIEFRTQLERMNQKTKGDIQ